MCDLYSKTDFYQIKKNLHMIMFTIFKSIENNIIPYIKTIDMSANIHKFWKNPQSKLYTHWVLLYDYLNKYILRENLN